MAAAIQPTYLKLMLNIEILFQQPKSISNYFMTEDKENKSEPALEPVHAQ
jgi:hypothetical protein